MLAAPGGATEPELDEPEQPNADADEREEADLEEPEEAASEESDVDDAASMSQYSNPNYIPDEQILNPQGIEDYADAFYRSELPCQAPDCPWPSKLTGFAADLSDAEDGRDDDSEPYPKKWKKANSRKWSKSLTDIAALKKDLASVPLAVFKTFYTQHHLYGNYFLDLMDGSLLSALPEIIYVVECNVSRKQEAQFWFEVAERWHNSEGLRFTQRDFSKKWAARHEVGVRQLASRTSYSSRVWHNDDDGEK